MDPHTDAWYRRYRGLVGPGIVALLLVLVPQLAPSHAASAASVLAPDGSEAPPHLMSAISGRVVDAGEGTPVPDASVRLEGTSWSAATDEDGRFVFDDIPVGSYLLVVEHLAYATVRDTVALEDSDLTYDVEVRLSSEAIEVEPVVVEAMRSTPLAEVHDRIERMESLGLGELFDRRAIEESGVTRVSHLVGLTPGARLQPIPGRVGASQLRLHPRNDCAPSFYVDGFQLEVDDESVDDFVPLGAVETLEVYRRSTMLPGEFADEQAQYCGAVVITTRRGSPGTEPFGWGRMIALAGFFSLSWVVSTALF